VKRSPRKTVDVDYSINNEMKRLQYFGAGTKTSLPTSIKEGENNWVHETGCMKLGA